MSKFRQVLKSLFFPLCILAVLIFLGFAAWFLSSHGTISMMRVNPLFLYVFFFVTALGVIFTALFFWSWRLYKKGRQKRGLSGSLFVVSIILIALFAVLFIQLSGFPPSKAIQPVTQLPIADIPEQSLHFAVGSDAHFGAGTNSPDKTASMLAQIADPANSYDIFFFLGDLVEYGFKDGEWQEAFNTFSTTANAVPVRFAPGNHDTIFGGLGRYLNYCAPATTGSKDTSSLWQRIDAGRVHFFMLDVEWSAETVTKAQKEWLEAELKSIPDGDWKIVLSHGFYYASGGTMYGWNWYDNPETIAALTPLFEEYGVDIVFSGHKHSQEILEHEGVTYIVTAAFGGHPDPESTYISPASLWELTGGAGFMDVTIDGDEATLIFRNYDSTIVESFTVLKD